MQPTSLDCATGEYICKNRHKNYSTSTVQNIFWYILSTLAYKYHWNHSKQSACTSNHPPMTIHQQKTNGPIKLNHLPIIASSLAHRYEAFAPSPSIAPPSDVPGPGNSTTVGVDHPPTEAEFPLLVARFYGDYYTCNCAGIIIIMKLVSCFF